MARSLAPLTLQLGTHCCTLVEIMMLAARTASMPERKEASSSISSCVDTRKEEQGQLLALDGC